MKRKTPWGMSLLTGLFITLIGLFTFMGLTRTPHSTAQSPPKASNANLLVRGYIVATPELATKQDQKDTRQRQIYLPGIKVFLKALTIPTRGPLGGNTRDLRSTLSDLHPNLTQPQFTIDPALLIRKGIGPGSLSLAGATPSTHTDLSGRFTLRTKKFARYRVCWEGKGYVSGCSETIIPAKPGVHHIGTQQIQIKTQTMTLGKRVVPLTTPVFGKVRLQDASLPRAYDPLANINVFAQVALKDTTKKVLFKTFVNNHGDYLIPQMPRQGEVKLEATLEKASNVITMRSGGTPAAVLDEVDIVISNHRPRIDPIVARDEAGLRVKIALPGEKVLLSAHARDGDGDPLKYKWLVSSGSGMLSETNQQHVTWILPSHPGRYSVKAIVYDGKGGYDASTLSLKTGKELLTFSGRVSGTDTPAIDGAQVEVNGRVMKTDNRGFFRLHVEDNIQFILNIRKHGYALVSRIYDDAVIGGRWTMTRASVQRVDPTQLIKVANRRKSSDCPGPTSQGIDWKKYPNLLTDPEWQDGKGNVIARPKLNAAERRQLRNGKEALFGRINPQDDKQKQDRQCGPGISVIIPPNALVDENNNPPVGKVDVQLSTIDLGSPEQMPGDGSARLLDGTTQVMQSYGAGIVEIYDGDKQYNLKPSMNAEITIPVDPTQLKAAGAIPSTIPFLFYDASKGMWIEIGKATLEGIGANSRYTAQTTHFTPFNADILKNDQACVRILSSAMGGNFNKLEWMVPQDDDAPRTRTDDVDNSAPSEHIIYNLPTNTNIVLVALDNDQPLGTFVVDTGGPMASGPTVPGRPGLPVGPPYEACATTVEMTPQTIPNSPPGSEEFLQGLNNYFKANNVGFDELILGDPSNSELEDALAQATTNYYENIDPREKRRNLADFITTNQMSGGEIRAAFANSGDLGFGRDMHCEKTWVDDDSDGIEEDDEYDIGCYVTNYGDHITSDEDDAAAAAAQDIVNDSNRIATVAMEYSRIESQPGETEEFDDPERVVKFYVYSGDGSRLLLSADLDGFGQRPVPQLCMVCHGGAYPGPPVTGDNAPPFNSREEVKLGARFLPFDLHFYTFAAAPFDRANQQDDFEALNKEIVSAALPADDVATDHIKLVVDKMYPAPGSDQDENFLADGWNFTPLEQTMYRDVIGRTCRACHLASPFENLRFTTSEQVKDILGSVETRVCQDYVMPHAKRTYDIFWGSTSPHMPGLLQIFGDQFGSADNGWNGGLCGEFTAGGDTPESFYHTNIQPIWNNNCGGCHIGSSFGGLSLAGAAVGTDPSYGNLLTNSTQVPALQRVQPSDAANSYLSHKMHNTQSEGTAMPQDVPVANIPISETTTVDDWINSGAPGP